MDVLEFQKQTGSTTCLDKNIDSVIFIDKDKNDIVVLPLASVDRILKIGEHFAIISRVDGYYHTYKDIWTILLQTAI